MDFIDFHENVDLRAGSRLDPEMLIAAYLLRETSTRKRNSRWLCMGSWSAKAAVLRGGP